MRTNPVRLEASFFSWKVQLPLPVLGAQGTEMQGGKNYQGGQAPVRRGFR